MSIFKALYPSIVGYSFIFLIPQVFRHVRRAEYTLCHALTALNLFPPNPVKSRLTHPFPVISVSKITNKNLHIADIMQELGETVFVIRSRAVFFPPFLPPSPLPPCLLSPPSLHRPWFR